MPNANFKKIIPHPIESVYKAITDFENYPKFVDTISKVSVTSMTAKSATLVCVAHFIKEFHFTLKVSKQKPISVTWTMESGDLFKRNDGQWILKETGPCETLVSYSMDVDFAIPMPGFLVKRLIGPTWDKAIESYLAQNLQV